MATITRALILASMLPLLILDALGQDTEGRYPWPGPDRGFRMELYMSTPSVTEEAILVYKVTHTSHAHEHIYHALIYIGLFPNIFERL